MDYAEITPYKSDSHVKQTKDIKVDYSKVESSFYEMCKSKACIRCVKQLIVINMLSTY